jgi:DNA-binding LacI/PurR family transcriptional regulator
MRTKPATIKDVAQESGVSTATVSYVLNNGPRRVDPGTRQRVLGVMERLQYHPSTMARGMSRKHLDCIGVVFPQPYPRLVADSYFSDILDGIIHVATERGQNVTLYTGLEWRGQASLPAFRDRRVDGLLLIAPLTDSGIVPALIETSVPFVLIDSTSENAQINSVDIDNADAALQVVGHLAALGHRRIALLGGQANSPSTRPRRLGFEQAMAQHGLTLDPALMIEGTYTREWGCEGMGRLLDLPNPPTAVFAGGDGIAAGAYQACTDRGLSVPEDLSVVGFDDAPYARTLTPPMTTVHHPLTRIGATAATLLLDCLQCPGDDCPATQIVLPTDLIVRESTAAPR